MAHAGDITPVEVGRGVSHVVVMGGTFDPPHAGHTELGAAARDAVDAGATLVVVPAGVSPLKTRQGGSEAVDRVAMTRMAFGAVPRCAVWTDEVDRFALDGSGPSYTVDTLERLRAVAPGAAVTLLMGSDQAANFHRWREPARILKLARVRVLLREPLGTWEALARELARAWPATEVAAWEARVLALGGVTHPARSTEIRERIARGGVASVPAGWLDASVASYIGRRGLYRGVAGGGSASP